MTTASTATPAQDAPPATRPEAPGRPATEPLVRTTSTRTARAATVNLMVAVVAVFLTGLRIPLGYGVVPGLAVGLILLPVWVPALKRYAGARLVVAVGLAALVFGMWLTLFEAQGRRVDGQLAFSTSVTFLEILLGVGVLLWARTHMATWHVSVVLGVGMIFFELLSRGQWGANPWKFAFVVPVALLLIGLAEGTGRRLVPVAALVLLGMASAVRDSRSAFAIFLLAAALSLWQAIPVRARAGTSRRAVRLVILGAIVAAAVYNIGASLVLDGYLGDAAEARSRAQVETSGNLLIGGRPELSATIALVRDEPLGFGPGALPTTHDVLVAKAGMRAVNYDPDNGYVENFMFGSQFRLHSVVGDLWAAFGPLGALWALLVLVVLIGSVAYAAAKRQAPVVGIWLTCLCSWNLFFGPLYGSAAALMAALGLTLVRVARTPRP
jgi:hypothetical protein